jgi:hypothetical protein
MKLQKQIGHAASATSAAHQSNTAPTMLHIRAFSGLAFICVAMTALIAKFGRQCRKCRDRKESHQNSEEEQQLSVAFQSEYLAAAPASLSFDEAWFFNNGGQSAHVCPEIGRDEDV